MLVVLYSLMSGRIAIINDYQRIHCIQAFGLWPISKALTEQRTLSHYGHGQNKLVRFVRRATFDNQRVMNVMQKI